MAAALCPLRFSYIVFVVYVLSLSEKSHASTQERKVHLVYMGALREGETSSTSSYHASMLQDVVDSNFLGKSLVRSYTRSFNAFAAYLTEEEGQKLASLDEVVSVFPSRTLQPQTTASWNFMGFPENVHRNPVIESDVILGVIDSGIWPESESFTDEGFGPPPKRWKGACKGGPNFTCNKKIIGARYYNSFGSPEDNARDSSGHGTHTASTAAGNNVKNTSFFDIASGTARGGVPSARIAVYKVCYIAGCTDADILAAFDDAIADGVDMITISVGGSAPVDFNLDAIAIGAFHAMAKGILTVNSAGNNGDSPGQISSNAPWIFTVAASSTNRRIVSKVLLGNGKTLTGNGVNSFGVNETKLPLVYGKDVSEVCGEDEARACSEGCVDKRLVKGKIVLCNSTDGVTEVYNAGALGAIGVPVDEAPDVSFVFPLPVSVLTPEDFKLVEDYINSTKTPQANILKSEAIRNVDAPVVASFSSKGPNLIVLEIMKPDVTAPGVEILAAFSPFASPSENPQDTRSLAFSVLSGTSMSCPHAAGAAAYVKTFHPDWSPSAIKSSLMTTAWRMNATKNKEAEFAYGAGQIDPLKAVNPGLVYETLRDDYIKMLCSIKKYNESSLRNIFGDNSTCPKGEQLSPKDLNYPSMTFQAEKKKPFSVKFQRTVTNVGLDNSTYKAKITSPPQFNITVEPDTLTFQALKERKSFFVNVTGNMLDKPVVSASLEWSDGTHIVRSPIAIFTSTLYKS